MLDSEGMKSLSFTPFAFALLSIAAISASGAAVPNALVLTENSDTSLTISWFDGTSLVGSQTVTTTTPDVWTFDSTGFFVLLSTGSATAAGWTEPDDSREINLVQITSGGVSGDTAVTLNVRSDYVDPDITGVANGATVDMSADNVNVTYNDLGDGVPDNTLTSLLLLVSAGGLFAVNRFAGRLRPSPVRRG